VVYRDVTRQAKGLYRLKDVGALGSGLAYLSRYNSGWCCHMYILVMQRLGMFTEFISTPCKKLELNNFALLKKKAVEYKLYMERGT
jgi:hypothetical protein